jgi:hypothetical protein
MPDGYPKFDDFAENDGTFEGEKKKIDEILNNEILVMGFKIKDSKQREGTSYATVQFKQDDNLFIFFTGSNVIINQLTKYEVNIPFYATIKKINKYYTFS